MAALFSDIYDYHSSAVCARAGNNKYPRPGCKEGGAVRRTAHWQHKARKATSSARSWTTTCPAEADETGWRDGAPTPPCPTSLGRNDMCLLEVQTTDTELSWLVTSSRRVKRVPAAGRDSLARCHSHRVLVRDTVLGDNAVTVRDPSQPQRSPGSRRSKTEGSESQYVMHPRGNCELSQSATAMQSSGHCRDLASPRLT